MSFDVNWDIDKYKEDHESDDHWLLRRNFMERWKPSYPEERLVCLARVFANIEFMGCRYPSEVMQEVARMSKEVNKNLTYNNGQNKTKLQRTFVSASDAAEDRARGTKREGGIVVDGPPKKSNKINFVKPGEVTEETKSDDENEKHTDTNTESEFKEDTKSELGQEQSTESEVGPESQIKPEVERIDYVSELSQIECLDVTRFRYNMFGTRYGKLNDARISVNDVSGNARPRDDEFGTPVETTVAS
ncbi:NF-kappa-B-repressing factor, partial [Operophtera brumata]